MNSVFADDEVQGVTRPDAIVLAIALLAAASLIYFAPVVADPSARVAGGATDPMLVSYIVTWVVEHVGTAEVWNPPFFHPAPNVLAYSDHMFGLALVAWPAVAAHFSPVTIVNLISWLGFLLTSIGIFWWLADSRGDVLPSCAAALTATYCAWRAEQLPHAQLIFLAFLPVALLCFQRVIGRRAPAGLVWAGAALLYVQTLFTASLTVFMLPLTAIWIAAGLALSSRREPAVLVRLAVALIAVGLLNVPIASHYWELGSAFERSPVEIARFSARLPDFLSAPSTHWLYGDLLAFTRGDERELFPGIGFCAVAAAGIVTVLRRNASDRPALVAVIVAIWASTGPSASGEITLGHLPYDLISALVPGGRYVRVPARFVLLAAIFAAPLLAAGWERVFDRVARLVPRPTLAAAVTMILAAVVVAEGMPGVVVTDPAPDYRQEALDRQLVSGALVFLPVGTPDVEVRRMWRARLRGVPTVNGYSGHPSYLWEALRHLQEEQTDEQTRLALYTRLLEAGVDTIAADEPIHLVDPAMLEPVKAGAYRIAREMRYPQLEAIPLGRGAGLLIPEFGWSYPERNETDSWVWTLDRRATLLIPMDGTPHREIALRVRSLDRSDPVAVALEWQRQSLGTRPLTREPTVVTFPLPEAATTRGWQRFELVGPAPRRVRASPDPRRLGVCLFEITFRN